MKPIYVSLVLLTAIHTNVVAQKHRYDPPWNAPPEKEAVQFTVKGIDNAPDIYGDINNPDLVVFLGGNQFMVLDELLPAFRKKHPQYKRILVETLPPGILLQQIKNGALLMGNMHITVKPDVYTSGKKTMEENASLFSLTRPYSATRLMLMVQKGNPKNIRTLTDLAGDSIRVSLPDKKIEGIGETIEKVYTKAGHTKAYERIAKQKVTDGSTFVTQIHHRQSPLRILNNHSDVAPVWETEVFYQQQLGYPVEGVPIPEEGNKPSVSVAGVLKNAPHKKAAQDFVNFLTGPEAAAIFKKYGFSLPAQ